jgi:carboxymethylenebutenolidase
MKKLLFVLLLLGVANGTQAQTCCALTEATVSFARLADDKAFVAAHANPLPFTYQGNAGTTVTFATPDGKTASGYLIKAARKSNKYLLVYQEWWGLNDYIKNQAAAFAKDLPEVNVLALDMYDGKVATNREEAAQYMQGASPDRLKSIMQGTLTYVGKKAKVASVGWCFGGSLSLQSALVAGKQAVGCVMYYGMPEKDVERLKTLKCDVLGLFAGGKNGFHPK